MYRKRRPVNATKVLPYAIINCNNYDDT